MHSLWKKICRLFFWFIYLLMNTGIMHLFHLIWDIKELTLVSRHYDGFGKTLKIQSMKTKRQGLHLQAARFWWSHSSLRKALYLFSPTMLTKSNVPLREEVCSTGSWRFCLPRMNFWLDQRPECCLYSLGFVWFYIQLLSSPVHRNWEDQSGPPIVCPITMVYFSFLHGPPAIFVWKSHHNLFHTFFLPCNF